MTKPGSSGSEEPQQAEQAPEPAAKAEPDTAAEAARTEPEPAREPEPEPASSVTEPKPGASITEPEQASSATEAGPASSAAEPGPAASASESGPASSAAEPGPATSATEAGQASSATEPEPVTSATAPEPAASAAAREAEPSPRARRAVPEDPEPLMAELEKAPPAPREQAIRAQAKRRFEEPPPSTLRFSFYFFTGAGAVWLFSMVISLIYKQDFIDAQVEANTNPDITPEMIASAVNQILWIVLVASLAFTVFLALFGYKATEGTRRARTLVTIFSVILVLFHLLLNGTPLGILSAFLALTGLALLWSPSARAYFAPREPR